MDRYAKTVELQNYVVGLKGIATDKLSAALSAMLEYLLDNFPSPPSRTNQDVYDIQNTAREIMNDLREGNVRVEFEDDLREMPEWFVPVAIFYVNVNIHRLRFDTRYVEQFDTFADRYRVAVLV